MRAFSALIERFGASRAKDLGGADLAEIAKAAAAGRISTLLIEADRVVPGRFNSETGMPPAMFRSSAKPLSGRYLSLTEREEIALLRVQGHSMQEIGCRLGRSASTISRELRRNSTTRGGGLYATQSNAPSSPCPKSCADR